MAAADNLPWRQRRRDERARRRLPRDYARVTTPPPASAWGHFGQSWIVPPLRVSRPDLVAVHDGVVVLEDCWMSLAPEPDATGPLLVLGERVRVGRGVQFSVARSVVVENDALIGDFAQIGDTYHPPEARDRMQALVPGRPVRIEAGAVVAGHAVVMPGVTIGRGAVVDHHAVVRHDVPPGAKVAGNPAKVVLT